MFLGLPNNSLMASERLECMNHSALRCSFYLENKKYRFFGHIPLPMKGKVLLVQTMILIILAV